VRAATQCSAGKLVDERITQFTLAVRITQFTLAVRITQFTLAVRITQFTLAVRITQFTLAVRITQFTLAVRITQFTLAVSLTAIYSRICFKQDTVRCTVLGEELRVSLTEVANSAEMIMVLL